VFRTPSVDRFDRNNKRFLNEGKFGISLHQTHVFPSFTFPVHLMCLNVPLYSFAVLSSVTFTLTNGNGYQVISVLSSPVLASLINILGLRDTSSFVPLKCVSLSQ